MRELFTDSISQILAIGVGTLGAHVAVQGSENATLYRGAPPAAWGVLHFERAQLLASGLERKLFYPLIETQSPEREAQLVNLSSEVAAMAEGRTLAILVGSLKEEHTAEALTALATCVRDAGLRVCMIVELETEEQQASELSALADLFIPMCATGGLPTSASAGQIHTQEPNTASEESLKSALFREQKNLSCNRTGGQATSGTLFNSIQNLLAATEALAGALTQGALDGTFTLAKLRQALRGAGPWSAGLSGNASLIAAAEAALFEASVDSPALPIGVALALLSSKEISNTDREKLAALCSKKFPEAKEINILIGSSVAEHLDDETSCLVLVRYAGSANVVLLQR